ncbi:hypothetical protein C8J57DRAFT_1259345 [Mycena rebaudengoi]|nr:hypothetical protein C8J57DRAFT_1259345 [Mycena rebaudengoi]
MPLLASLRQLLPSLSLCKLAPRAVPPTASILRQPQTISVERTWVAPMKRDVREWSHLLEYLRETGMLIVTYPTAVHESFGTMMNVFTDIAARDKSFIVGNFNNTEISIPGIRRRRIPDLVFVPTVDTVITIKFTKSRASSPVDLATFSKDWVLGLGDVVYDGYAWAHAISGYIHPGSRDEAPDFDAEQLAKNQDEIVDLLRLMTRHFMGTPAFDAIYPDEIGFTINWRNFYETIRARFLADAYRRYVRWVNAKPTVTAQAVKSKKLPGLLKRTRQWYGDGSDSKRTKLDYITHFAESDGVLRLERGFERIDSVVPRVKTAQFNGLPAPIESPTLRAHLTDHRALKRMIILLPFSSSATCTYWFGREIREDPSINVHARHAEVLRKTEFEKLVNSVQDHRPQYSFF